MASSPAAPWTLDVDALERTLSGADAAAIEALEAPLGEHLTRARDAGALPAAAHVLRLQAMQRLRAGRAREAAPLAQLAVEGFGLLGEEGGWRASLQLLVLALGEGRGPCPHALAFFDEARTGALELLAAWRRVVSAEAPRRAAQATDAPAGGESAAAFFAGLGRWRPGEAALIGEGCGRSAVIMAPLLARLRAPLAPGQAMLPIQRMMRRLSLGDVEVWLLLLLQLGHSDPFIRQAFLETWGDANQRGADVAFLSGMLLGAPSPIWSLLQTTLAPSAPLRLLGLIETERSPRGLDLVALSDSAVRLMAGARGLPSELTEWCRDLDPARDGRSRQGHPELDRVLGAWTRRRAQASSGHLRVMIRGSARGDRRRVVEIACERSGLSVIQADLGVLRHRAYGDLLSALGTLAREVGLSDRVVLLELPAQARDEQQQQQQGASLRAALERALERFSGPVLFSLEPGAEASLPSIPGAIEVEVALINTDQQLALWRESMAHLGLAAPDDQQLRALVQRFPLGADAIEEATRELSVRASLLDETPDPDALISAAGRKTRDAMSSIAQRLPMTLGWDDIVLPDDTVEALREIAAFARHRGKVLDDWGFRAKLPYGRALSALFHGPPGTGKTMMAGIIARDLGMELFRIDLSQVVSKYIGETEKNLGRAFDEATRNHAVLLFDEADSLFSKRTEVKSSNDRYANLEVNFLLQRMEDFEGVTILTTNAEKSIDDAFKRRIRFKIEFPFPDLEQRRDLWRIMIPARAEVEGRVDFGALAEDFEMSGGSIKNAVLRAAFIAAERGKAIGFDELWLAGRREYSELGHLVREGGGFM